MVTVIVNFSHVIVIFNSVAENNCFGKKNIIIDYVLQYCNQKRIRGNKFQQPRIDFLHFLRELSLNVNITGYLRVLKGCGNDSVQMGDVILDIF